MRSRIGRALLSFLDELEKDAGSSHPEEESKMALAVFSLFTNSRFRSRGIRLNHIDIPRLNAEVQVYPEFFGELETGDLQPAFDRLYSLDDDLCRQYVRAAKTYSLALDFIPHDPTFAFFLLVVSVECLSSQDAVLPHGELNPSKMSCERYCRFIKEHLREEDKGNDERDDPLITELLKTAYFAHRSGFAHGGKEVPVACVMADKVSSSYFKSLVDGKEQKSPGIGWFARMVRSALTGFLLKRPVQHQDTFTLSGLARERSGLEVKFKRSVEAHHVVTFADIEYR